MAKPYDAIKWVLRNTSAITAIIGNASGHGQTVRTTKLPNCAFFESGGPGQWNGMERQEFTINNRAATLDKALDLARVVVRAFNGSSATGMTGSVNGFDFSRAFLSGGPNIVSEPNKAYNAPVTVTIIYPVDTVS